MATGCEDGTVQVIDIATKTTHFELADQHSNIELQSASSFLPLDCAVHLVKFSPDGSLLATSGSDNSIKIWDTETGGLTHTLAGHRASVRAVAWSPKGQSLASAAMDNTCRMWQLAPVQL